MFFVFNKQKIYSYIIAFSTVAILLVGANIFIPKIENTVETSGYPNELNSNYINEKSIENELIVKK